MFEDKKGTWLLPVSHKLYVYFDDVMMSPKLCLPQNFLSLPLSLVIPVY